MKTNLIHIVIIFFMFSLLAEAQTNVQVSKKDFKQEKQGFNEAWNHVQEGDKYFSEGGKYYSAAFDEYIKAIVYNSSNPELNYKTGVSALLSDSKEEAAPFLLKAMETKKVVAEDILLVTGRALQYQERYAEAIPIFDEFLNSPGKKSKELISLAQKFQAECNSGLIVTQDTLRIEIENLGENINSAFDDFSEILTGDGRELYFASRREAEKITGGSDQNIFYSALTDSSWMPSVLAGENITTKFSETPVHIDSTGNILYIYAGYENNGDIKMSARRKGKWNYPQDIPYPVNTDGSETSFFIGSAGTEIYFVSDGGRDNFGGKDIYYVSKITERRWSKPVNAGSIINTSSDEESVVLSKTGDTIWFSSKGHNSIGGYDVFYSVRKDGEWDTVKNIGYPVNSPWDEVFYKPSPADDSLFYFVSNRKGGYGGLDIYTGKISPADRIPDKVLPEQPIVLDKEGTENALDPAGLKKEEKLFF